MYVKFFIPVQNSLLHFCILTIEMLPDNDHKYGAKVDSAIEKMSRVSRLLRFLLEGVSPLLVTIFAISPWNPLYTLLRAIHNFELYGPLVSLSIQAVLGFFSATGVTLMFETLDLCLILMGYSIGCLYLWTMFLVPITGKDLSYKLRPGLGFFSAVKMYKMLHVMTILEEELFREFVNPCLHHFTAVSLSTYGLFTLLAQISNDAET